MVCFHSLLSYLSRNVFMYSVLWASSRDLSLVYSYSYILCIMPLYVAFRKFLNISPIFLCCLVILAGRSSRVATCVLDCRERLHSFLNRVRIRANIRGWIISMLDHCQVPCKEAWLRSLGGGHRRTTFPQKLLCLATLFWWRDDTGAQYGFSHST